MSHVHVLGLDTLSYPHECRAAQGIAEQLSVISTSQDAFLCFGLNLGIEMDCLLLAPSGPLIGELKEWPYRAFGFEMGSWERMLDGNRLQVMPGEQNPLRQAQRQRSLLAKRLSGFELNGRQASIRKTSERVDWHRLIRAGLVQCPRLNLEANVSPSTYPWWFADGLDDFISRAIRRLGEPPKILSQFYSDFLGELGVLRPSRAPMPVIASPDSSFAPTPAEHHLIISGPGGGKTQQIVNLIASISKDGGDISRIYAISYTNHARDVLRDRVQEELGKLMLGGPLPQFGTIHQFARRISEGSAASEKQRPVLDQSEAQDFFEGVAYRHGLTRDDFGQLVTIVLKSDGANMAWPSINCKEAWQEYRLLLAARGRQTFETMLQDALDKVAEEKVAFEIVFVDEFQDTNGLQLELLRRLAERGVKIVAVGDEEQAIFGWAGAIERPFKRFQEIFGNATQKILPNNYRSGSEIVSLVAGLRRDKLQQQVRRDTKGVVTSTGTVSLRASSREIARQITELLSRESNAIAPGTIAVLSRTNWELDVLENLLKQSGIPVQRGADEEFKDLWRMKALLHGIAVCDPDADLEVHVTAIKYLLVKPFGIEMANAIERALCYSSADAVTIWQLIEQVLDEDLSSEALESTMDFLTRVSIITQQQLPLDRLIRVVWEELMPPVGFLDSLNRMAAEENVLRLIRLAEHGGGTPISFVEFVLQGEGIKDERNRGDVRLATVHQAKGDEWDIVFLLDVSANVFPNPKAKDITEEQRLLHVAASRARDELHLFYVESEGLGIALAEALPPSVSKTILRSPVGGEPMQEARSSVGNSDFSYHENAHETNYLNRATIVNTVKAIFELNLDEKIASMTQVVGADFSSEAVAIECQLAWSKLRSNLIAYWQIKERYEEEQALVSHLEKGEPGYDSAMSEFAKTCGEWRTASYKLPLAIKNNLAETPLLAHAGVPKDLINSPEWRTMATRVATQKMESEAMLLQAQIEEVAAKQRQLNVAKRMAALQQELDDLLDPKAASERKAAKVAAAAAAAAEPVQITKTERDEVLALIDAIPSRKVGLNGSGSSIPDYSFRK
ncbi:MAG: UvrD-helicase domain-containing protein [Candidatus Accumulibacter sp.]|nr:UvrD-helicase domain-containing protein [Accumulibacter sp.]